MYVCNMYTYINHKPSFQWRQDFRSSFFFSHENMSLLVGWLKNRMNKTRYISSYSNNTYIIYVYIYNIYIHISVILPKVRTVNSHNFTRILLSIFFGVTIHKYEKYWTLKLLATHSCNTLTNSSCGSLCTGGFHVSGFPFSTSETFTSPESNKVVPHS